MPESAQPAKTHPAESTAPGALPVPRELLVAGVPLDEDVEVERQQRLEAMKAQLKAMLDAGRGDEMLDQVLAAIVKLERENDRLAWRVLRANRFRFGRSTEKLSKDELGQLLLAFGASAESVAADDPEVPVPEPPGADGEATEAEGSKPSEKGKGKRKRRRKMTVSPNVERNVRVVPLAEDERTCGVCGAEMEVFGHCDHETIRYVPAKIVVDVERREKAGCKTCRQDIAVAPREQAPAVIRKVDASLIAKLLAEKCALGLPLDRQRRELYRLGLDIPDKTLQSYWAYGTDSLEPVADATASLVFGDAIVGADDSHLKTVDRTSKKGVFRGRFWCFVGSDGIVGSQERVAYGYTPSREASEITDWFSVIDGFIQCDGYAGYSTAVEDDETGETMVAVPPHRRLGCGMHIRSKFHAALLAKDKRAAVPMKHFADLYQIEALCKREGLDAAGRQREREQHSIPILDSLDSWVDEIHPRLLPKSPLRRATTYAINQRPFFRRCFEDGRFEIDNGRTERRIRPFAVARRNFLFTGSLQGGRRLATAFTLVENCLTLGIDPERYLHDVIDRLERGWPGRRLSELIPHNWAAEQTA